MTDAATGLVGLLADPVRLRVLAAVVLGSTTASDVIAATGLDSAGVHRAMARLSSGGLLGADGGRLVVHEHLFRSAVRAAADARPKDSSLADAGATPEQADVLRNFMVDGRLATIPASRAKRLVVLDFLAAAFEPGRVYPERDVNFELGKRHADFAALRRYLVDEGFLERRDGFYWRSGGTFEVDQTE